MVSAVKEEILLAQNDEQYMNLFIQQNKRFIMACAYRSLKHFVTESDDEWSVAMIAFHEAVMSYEEDRGEFRSFASVVISRRLLDFSKSELRHKAEIPVEPGVMSGDLDEQEEITPLQLEIRRKEAQTQGISMSGVPGSSAVRDEIEAVQGLLARYGFSFFDLADCSPKAGKTKHQCAAAVVCLLEDEALFRKMRRERKLPAAEIRKCTGVSGKVLERHRKYLIAAAEILNGDYPLLAEYMNYIRKALSP